MEGTISLSYRVSEADVQNAIDAAPQEFQARLINGLVEYTVWYGPSPSVEVQREARELVEESLKSLGIDFVIDSYGHQVTGPEPWWVVSAENYEGELIVQAWDQHEAEQLFRDFTNVSGPVYVEKR